MLIFYFIYFIDSDEIGPNKRLLGQVPKCRRGRITYEIRADKPRCHHYFWSAVGVINCKDEGAEK